MRSNLHIVLLCLIMARLSALGAWVKNSPNCLVRGELEMCVSYP
jgi:hypothetical protein